MKRWISMNNKLTLDELFEQVLNANLMSKIEHIESTSYGYKVVGEDGNRQKVLAITNKGLILEII